MDSIIQPDIEVLFSSSEISNRIDALAEEIAAKSSSDLLVVAILKGSFIFAADLIRAFHSKGLAPEVDFLFLASYGDKKVSSGSIEILRDVQTDVINRDILIVDDMLESGRTLAFAKGLLEGRGAAQVQCCVLLNKPVKRAGDIEADYVAFDCPDLFVVGYGMDLAHRYRQLPFVGRIMSE